MKTSWERNRGKKTSYASIRVGGLTMGEHYGSGQTDNAGTCSLAEFLAGKWQAEMKVELGARALTEALSAARSLVEEGAPTMRAWTTADGNTLFEGPRHRVRFYGPAPDDASEKTRTAHHYFLLEPGGDIVRRFKGGSFSLEDELTTWSYRVIDDEQLIEYRTIVTYRQSAKGHEKIELEGLVRLADDRARSADAQRAIEAASARRRAFASARKAEVDAVLQSFRDVLPRLHGDALQLVLDKEDEKPWAYRVLRQDGRIAWRTTGWSYHGVDLYNALLKIARKVLGERLDRFEVDRDLRASMSWSDR